MSTALRLAQLVIRVLGLTVTVLGVVLLATHNQTFVPLYAATAFALMLGLWMLGFLAGLARVHLGQIALIVLISIAVPLMSVTGEWPLYVFAGVGALAQSEHLAPGFGSVVALRGRMRTTRGLVVADFRQQSHAVRCPSARLELHAVQCDESRCRLVGAAPLPGFGWHCSSHQHCDRGA